MFGALAIGPIILLRHQAAALYSTDVAVQALAADLLLFAGFGQLFDATQVDRDRGALRGYKVTLAPLVLMLVAFWALGVPVGTWPAYHGLVAGAPLKVYGFWVGLVHRAGAGVAGPGGQLRRVADAAVRKASLRSLKFNDTWNSRGSPGCTVMPRGSIAAVGVTR